jgi:hypothetical protein
MKNTVEKYGERRVASGERRAERNREWRMEKDGEGRVASGEWRNTANGEW